MTAATSWRVQAVGKQFESSTDRKSARIVSFAGLFRFIFRLIFIPRLIFCSFAPTAFSGSRRPWRIQADEKRFEAAQASCIINARKQSG